MAFSTVNRLIALFDDAFKGLSRPIDIAQCERLAVIVHQSMNSKRRVYHRVEHVFPMCVDMAPTQVLAALFHDLIYFQLDGGFPPCVQHLLKDVAVEQGGGLAMCSSLPTDPGVQLCAALFNVTAGQDLPPYGGTNEFLSAVVAARLLAGYLDIEHLIAVIACIEATVPFRAIEANGECAMGRLQQRLAQQYIRWVGPESQSFVDRSMHAAVALGNRDVSGFGKSNPGVFLSSTWLLIDESNAELANPGVYSVQEYRGALVRMGSFLANLDPLTIFQRYQDVPSAQEMESLSATARRNIGFACEFLDAKVTSIAIIEALVLCTGPDCPISMLLGDIRSDQGKPVRVEDFLPDIPTTHAVNSDLLHVFEHGRPLESSHDLTASPLTAFIYRCLGQQGTRQAFEQACLMFAGQLTPVAYLKGLRADMVLGVLHACAAISLSRRTALQALAPSLEN